MSSDYNGAIAGGLADEGGVRVLHLIRETPGADAVTAATGIVADVAVFPDGQTVLRWRTHPRTTEIYESEASLREVRQSSGRSRLKEAR